MSKVRDVLRTKLFYHVLFICAIVSIFGSAFFYTLKISESTYLQTYSKLFLNFFENEQKTTFTRLMRIFSIWAYDINTKNPDKESYCQSTIVQEFGKDALFANIYASDKDGRLLCSLRPNTVPPISSVADFYYYQQVVKTKAPFIGNYQIGKLSGKRSIVVAYPNLDKNGDIKNILFISLNLDWINAYLSTLHIPVGSELLIMDRQGMVELFVSPNQDLAGKKVFDQNVLNYITSRENGFVEALGGDGERRVYSFQHFTFNEGTAANSYQIFGLTPAKPTKEGILVVVYMFAGLFAVAAFEVIMYIRLNKKC